MIQCLSGLCSGRSGGRNSRDRRKVACLADLIHEVLRLSDVVSSRDGAYNDGGSIAFLPAEVAGRTQLDTFGTAKAGKAGFLNGRENRGCGTPTAVAGGSSVSRWGVHGDGVDHRR